jgi:WD40 repeat protein
LKTKGKFHNFVLRQIAKQNNILMKNSNKLIYIFFAFTLLTGNLWSGIYLVDYSLKSYPSVSVRYFLFGQDNLPVYENNINDYRVIDNGQDMPVQYQNCMNINPAQTSNILVSIDLSVRNDILSTKFDKAKSIIGALIDNSGKYNSRIAISSFDEMPYLNCDFSADANLLKAELNKIKQADGSVPDTGFLQSTIGSIALLKNQNQQKTIIYFTSVHSLLDTGKIITEANKYGIKILVVFIGDKIPASLITISGQTGGMALLQSDTGKVTDQLGLALLALSRNYNPCDLTWLNKLNCDEKHNAEIRVAKYSFSHRFNFDIDFGNKPRLELFPEFLRFSSVYPGSSKAMNVTFTARNGDISINDLFIQNPKFVIDSGDIPGPVLLMKDSSHTVRVKFMPTDSAIVFDSLMIKSNACSGTNVLITGGYPNTPPKDRTLTLLTPACNEKLIVNDTATVSWSGLLPADVIQLQYSTDNGKTWDTLATDITGLEYKWVVPDKVSDSCLVRIIQLWPNNFGQTMVLQHQAGVNCANFNQDGSLVITASKDSKNSVRIWNANNGQLIYELMGHDKPINWVNFDYQDRYAVSSSEDSTVIIWDVKKGELVKRLKGHNHDVRAANFSPSGKYISSVSADGKCYIWDVQTGAILDSSFYTGNQLWFSCFSPDEKYVVITDNNGSAVVFNFSDKKLYKVFKSIGVVPYASFSQDMTKFSACSWFGHAKVWDFNSGTELFTVTHDSNKVVPLYSSNFDNSGNLFLTAGYDTVPRLWNATTGKEIATLLNEHTSSVKMASFNFDAKRILTASADSTAKVWNREQIGLQVDTSDCTFSIRRIDALAMDVDFGDTPIGYVNDTIVKPFLTNRLSFPLKVIDYRIIGTNSSEFEVINAMPPYNLDSSSERYIELRFKPSGFGLRKAQLELSVPGSKIIAQLSGNGTQEPIVLKSNLIDMGAVEIGDSRDTLVLGYIRNASPNPVTIDSISILGPDFYHFNITEPPAGFTLGAGQLKDVKIRFTPENVGRANTVFRLHHNGSNKVKDFSVIGEGIMPRIDTARIIVGSGSAKAGETIDIPVKISGLSKLGISPEITGFNITLEFNATMLSPVDNSKPVRIVNGSRFIDLTLPSVFSADSVLTTIQFKVGLGNDTSTVLSINDISLIGKGKMVLTTVNGVFSLEGYCTSGSNRLFESEGRIALLQNIPNPANDITEISFEVIESGLTSLFVVDIQGNKIKTLHSGNLKPGQYSIMVNTGDLPSGTVFYLLQTPTVTITKTMNVIH